MGREIVDIAVVELDGQQLETVVKLEIKKTDKKTPVKTMRPKRRAIGTYRGVPDWNGTMTVVYLVGTNEVDWDTHWKAGKKSELTYEKGIGGERRTLVDWQIDDISEPYDKDGETLVDISWVALDDRKDS